MLMLICAATAAAADADYAVKDEHVCVVQVLSAVVQLMHAGSLVVPVIEGRTVFGMRSLGEQVSLSLTLLSLACPSCVNS